MPPSDDKPDEPAQPLRGKPRERSDASSRDAGEVSSGMMRRKPRRYAPGTVRIRSDASAVEDQAPISKTNNSPSDDRVLDQTLKRDSIGNLKVSREFLNKLIAQGKLHVSPSPSDPSLAVFDLEHNPELAEVVEGWVDSKKLLRWFRDAVKQGQISPFDLSVGVCSLMMLRWLEAHEEESRAIAEFEGERFSSIIEPSHGMASWPYIHESRLSNYLESWVIPNLHRAHGSEYAMIADRIADGLAQLSRLDDGLLRELAHLFSKLNPATRSGRASGSRFLNALLEWLLKQSRGSSGEFHSTKAVAELMVAIADPAPGERVYDPCFGTGHLLALAARYQMGKAKATDTDAWGQIRRNGIYGREINPAVFLIGLTRIAYEGVDLPRLEVGDSLEAETFDGGRSSGFDCILANPPFGIRTREHHRQNYPFPMPDGDGLFLQHIVQSLRPGGRAVVLMPQGVLFKGGRMKELRRYLVERSLLKQVIALPDGVLKPYTNVPVNLLVFERTETLAPVRFLNLKHVDLPSGFPGKFDELAKINGASSYDLTLEDLAGRDWDLVVREEVTEELTSEIAELASLYPDVELAPLGKVAEIKRGISYRRELTTENIDEAGPDPIRLIRVSDLQKGEILRSQLFLRPGAIESIPGEAILRGGDIVLSVNGTIGKIAFYPGRGPMAVATSGLALIRSKHRGLSQEYLFSLLHSEAYQKLLSSVSRGSTIQSVPVSVLKDLEIPMAPIPTQDQVARHVIEEQGDGFAYLRRVLANAEEDPFITWLEESAEVEAVITSAKEGIERDRLIIIQRVAQSIRTTRNQLVHAPSSSSVSRERLFGWLNMLSDAAAKLTTVASVNDLAERFNLLHNAAVQAMASTFLIPDEQSSLGKRASMLTRSLQRLLEREVAAINALQRIEILCDDEVSPDILSEVSMTIVNHGPLPLREIEIRDSHSAEPGDFISYLAAEDSHRFMIRLFTADVEEDAGRFFADLIVTGTRMNDERFESEESVSVKIIEHRDDEKREPRMRIPDPGKRRSFAPSRMMMEDRPEPIPHESPGSPEQNEDQNEEVSFQKAVVQSFAADLDEVGEASEINLGFSPYTAGTPVPSKMYGREATLNRIIRQVSLKGQANVILLEGNRRTGKTSLLERLEMGDLTPDCVVVYVDCQEGDSSESKPGLPTAEVWRSIAKAISEKLIASGYRSPDFSGEGWIETFNEEKLNEASRQAFDSDHPYETFKRFLTRALEQIAPKRLVLMLDEFDKLQEGVENGITSPSVFQNIRHLAHTHTDLSLILAGTPLLKHLREQHWSALYGFGISVRVSFLNEADARSLITEPVAGLLKFSEAAIERLIEATNGQPYLLQSLCNTVFLDLAEEGSRRTVSIKDVDHAIQEMAESGGHFRDLWNFAGTERRRLLLALAQRKSRSEGLLSRSTILEELAEFGVSVPKNERIGTDLEYLRDLELLKLNKHSSSQHYTLLVPLFGEWIEENEDFEDVVERAVIESEHNLR